MKKQSRLKIIAASIILLGGMAFLVVTMTRSTSMRHFTPAALVADASSTDDQLVQVDGLIAAGSSQWDAVNFKLTFAVRDRETEATVNVIYEDRLKPDNFKDGGSVFVEGRYHASQNLVVATKLMTKCASKYEGAESAGSTDETSYASE
ncbi:cytochrome c maturation protein CcmE [Candidatus Poribacteria bacterium]|nr:cytochrome c maturation protein CcmE [Candidatus Poribacteria bacterium]MYB01473.1 cytochrome c maturation protein CcmE [Candidatus Poribacteria bacterium]